jgi:transmembrane sensor
VDENKPGGSPLEEELSELELLVDYIAGTATPREREELEARIRSDPSLHGRLEQTRLLWERAGSAFEIADPDAAVEALRSRVERSISSTSVARAPLPIIRQKSAPWYRGLIAASVLLLVAAALLRAGLFGGGSHSPVASTAVERVEFVSGPGERRTIGLSDGTRITLAPGSVLRAQNPLTTGTGTREVQLEGHGYFAVTPDAAHPFVVRTARAVTRVLGTEFDVRAYPETGATEVVVRSGRVALSPPSEAEAQTRVLTSGDRGTVEPGGEVRVENGLDTSDATAWTQGRLVFRAAPASEVVAELERWYGLRIQLTDPAMGERRITAVFTNEPVDLMLQTMADLLRARWQRADREVVFSPR